MSERGYLSKNDFGITQQEDTPVGMRIQVSNATVKALQNRLQQAYRKDDVRLVRRTTVLIDLLVHHVPVAVLGERWGLSPACIYAWQKAFMLCGMDSLIYRHGGGRPEKLTPRQKKRLVELIEAGPLVVGFETACWNSVLIRVLIWREFGVLYNRHYVCTLLHNVGFSFQKARFAQWGSLSYTWARCGRQPEVPTSGKRKGYKVFGAIEYFSGRLFYQGIEGRFNSENYQTFLQMIMDHTTEHLFLIHDGARYHTSASTQAFLAAHSDRITEHPLPSYSPDYSPIEYLWRNTKKRATHNKYFKEFAALTVSVDKALAYFALHPDTVLGLFGRYREESGLELKQVA